MFTETRFASHEKIAKFPTVSAVSTLKSVFGGQPLETIAAGSAVFWEGDRASHVFAIEEGVVRVFKILQDGRRVITGFVYPGDLLGISLKDEYLYSAEALATAKLRRLRRAHFHGEINRSPELRPLLFALLCDEMAVAQDQMVLLARKTAEERVSSFLLGSSRRLSNEGAGRPVVDIPMTRQDMADYLGLTIETVSRLMAKLTRSGVIAATGRHSVTIRKPKSLALLAGECDGDDSGSCNSAANVVRPAIWSHHA